MENFMASSSSSSSIMETAWGELPSDITALILQKLSSVEVLTTAQNVCREWRRVCRDPSMWRRINMRMDKTQFYTSMEKLCRNAVDLSQGQLTHISIQDFGSSSLLRYIVQRSTNLKSLQLCATFISSRAIIKACKHFPLLEELHLYYNCMNAEAVEAIGRSCPLLKSFKLNKTVNCGPFIKCDLDARAVAENMPQLRHLQLYANNMTDEGLHAILEGCPHLESLDLTHCYNVHFAGDLQRLCSQRIKNLSYPLDYAKNYQSNALIYEYVHSDGVRRFDV